MCASSPGALEVADAARCQVETYGRPGTRARWTFEVAARLNGGRVFAIDTWTNCEVC